MRKYVFKAEPGIRVTVESTKDFGGKVDAMQIGIFVLQMHGRHLSIAVEASSEDVVDEESRDSSE